MTKRDFYEAIKRVAEDMQGNDSEFNWAGDNADEVVTNTDIAEFCDKEIALLDKRAEKKTSKLEDTETLDTIVQIVTDNQGADCTRVAQAMGWNTQKATPYLKKLVADGRITMTKVKGRNTYAIA